MCGCRHLWTAHGPWGHFVNSRGVCQNVVMKQEESGKARDERVGERKVAW